jgi:hypothetical protein
VSRVGDCAIIDLPKIDHTAGDRQGNLTFVEGGRHVPFDVRRVFYIYDVPSGADRGAHAHKTLHQFLVCLQGSFEVQVDDGVEKRLFALNRPWRGLHVPPMIWASEMNFAPGTICLVLASAPFDAADYIRDYPAFLAAAQGSAKGSD